MSQNFAEKLKAIREKAGLTQEDVARATGLSVSTVSKLERPAMGIDPSWSTIQALAAALGVDCRVFEDFKKPKKK